VKRRKTDGSAAKDVESTSVLTGTRERKWVVEDVERRDWAIEV